MKAQAIVYTSCTGNTRRYAHMLGRDAGIPVLELSEAGLPRNAPVLYLGWLMAGGVKGLKKALRRFDVRAVCAVGMALPEQVDREKLARDNGLDAETPLFYLRGGYAPRQLPGLYRMIIVPMARAVAKRPAETEAERSMRDAFVNGGCWVTEEQLLPVRTWLEG